MTNRSFTTATRSALAAALLTLSLAAGASATQTENQGIHAVPAPAGVKVDGKLDDWDLSGAVTMCYDLDTLKDVYSARVAIMYDADNLYVGIEWADTTPMGNSHDPRYQPDRGWAGDSVQLRVKTDRITHVTAWYFAGKKEPAVLLDYGKDLTKPFGGGNKQLFQQDGWKLSDGAEMAFRKNDDGKGYVQELKLPWKLVTLEKRYKAGDRFNCGFELLWGEADWPVHRYADNLSEGASGREFFFTNHPAWGPVFLEEKGNLKLPTPAYLKAAEPTGGEGPVAIGYDLPEDARVTLAIDDAAGKRVRNLTPALPRKKGRNEEKWDGLNDDGKPVPPGEYQFKAIYHQPIHINWAMSFANPGHPTWQTPDERGAFYGDHSAAQAVAAAGEFVALACPIGEAGKHLIGCDLSGHRLWGLANRGGFYAGRISLATDGKLLWVAQDKSGTVYRVNIATGKYAPWNLSAKDADGNPYSPLDISVFDAASQKEDKAPINLTAIALHDGVLAVCLARDNKIRLLSADTGEAKGEVAVENPRAAAYDRDGSLVVVSKDRLVRVAPDGKIAPLGDADMADAFGVATDGSGNVYVSMRGKRQNVAVFDRAGKPMREIGTPGGRPNCGPFDDQGIRQPAGLAIDTKGRLWVTEEAQNPKRTSVWDVTSGKLRTDFVGSTAYAAAGAINAHDPTTAFSDDTVYKIDLATGAWRPVYSLARSDNPDDYFPPTAGSHSVVRVHDGKPYVYTGGTGMVRCMTLRDGGWRAVAAVGVVGRETDKHTGPFHHPKMTGHAGEAYAWSDLNGDGLVQPDELTIGTTEQKDPKKKAAGVQGMYWGMLPDEAGVITMIAPAAGGLAKFPVTRWTDQGAPVYDAAHPSFVPVDQPTLGADACFLMGGTGGRVYINQKPLTCIGPDGKVLWTYPSNVVSVHGSHNATAARPGYLIGPLAIAGTADLGGDAGEVFDINGNLGEHYLFTADGLYVQSLFKDTRGLFDVPNSAVRGMSMDATTSGGEDFGANFVRTPDGKVYLTNGGTDARVHEVTGLETIKRLGGKFTYTADQYAAAQQQAQDAAAKSTAAKTYAIEKAATPPAMKGKAEEWPELADDAKPALDIAESAKLSYARVAARYDAEKLYLAYRVKSPTGRMRNAGQDEQLLFKTGDCVDLMLRADPGEKGGDKAADKQPGGVRLLVSVLGDKPVAVLYEKTRPGTAKDARVPFSSPWRTIYFDRVRRLADAKVVTAPAKGGYLVEVAVPWSDLGVKPTPGLRCSGDVGVLSADPGGTTTVSRHYWSNKATGLVNDVPGEADLTPALWGSFVLK